jgi:hypothetical protein
VFEDGIYYLILLLCVSFIWLAESNQIRNISGSSSINLLSSDIYETNLEIRVDDYLLLSSNNSSEYKVFIDNGKSILDSGSPDIPKLTTSIIIPDNLEMEINIGDVEYTDYSNIQVIPSKGNLTRDVDPNSISYDYNESYDENNFYPGELAELSSPFILRDVRGQSVIIYPVQYNPVTKILRIYNKINIEVKSTGISNNNSLSRNSNTMKSNLEYMNIYNDFFINSNNDTRFEYAVDEGGMLIICYDDFIDEMIPFVNWKNRKGIPTEIVGLNEIGGSAAEMQTYINNYYDENNLTYLLLVGDINQMQTHIVNGAAFD